MSQTTPSTGSDDTRGLTSPDRSAPPSAAGPGPDGHRRPTTLIVALLVAVVVIVVLVALLVWQRDGRDDTVTQPATTEVPTTVAPTTAPTTAPSTTTSIPAPVPGDTASAVFPDPSTSLRFDDPVAAARAFAVDFAGFTDPVLGEFMPGDPRSGEVEVRPKADGPATTVIVRRLGADDSWWVLGSATADITLATPAAGDPITSPVVLTGSALAFEGHVDVEVRQDGSRAPVGTGFVTGGGDVVRPFSGEVGFTAPTSGHGALVLFTTGAEDGRVWQVVVIRVAFG